MPLRQRRGIATTASERPRSERRAGEMRQAVNATDSERRRIARDLHDGTQQHLAVLLVWMDDLIGMIRDEPDDAIALAGRLRAEIERAVDELRDVVHGIYPPMLALGGLPRALHTIAHDMPVVTTVRLQHVARYDPEIEHAVYFTCTEALQNAVKHARSATAIAVGLSDDGRRLALDVRDDGPGIRPQRGLGVGLASMRDRIASVGGRLTITSRVGAGTHLRAVVPSRPPFS